MARRVLPLIQMLVDEGNNRVGSDVYWRFCIRMKERTILVEFDWYLVSKNSVSPSKSLLGARVLSHFSSDVN